MKKFSVIIAALVGVINIAALVNPASACTISNWTKISGNSFADTIKGRDCGGTMSVRMTGGFGDTGWIPMYKNGTSDFKAQYGDGQVLTDIHLKVNGVKMTGSFHHKAATGTSFTKGKYHLN